jgi:hypothetical protein
MKTIQQEYDNKRSIEDWKLEVLDDLETKPIEEWDDMDMLRSAIIGYLPIVDST